MKSRAKLVTGLAIGVIAVSILAMPLALFTLPNPGILKIPTLAHERYGTYLGAEKGFYKLYPYASAQNGFPKGSPVTGEIPSIYIKFRRLDNLSLYGLYTFPHNQPIPARKEMKIKQILKLEPKGHLKPGLYYITAARDGMYGGQDYFYFEVQTKSRRVTRFTAKNVGVAMRP